MSKYQKYTGTQKRLLSVSQNFLTSRRVLERIVALSTITKSDTVLEIGFSKGHLTQVLCRKSGFLYAVELDDDLFEKTSRALSSVPNLRLIRGDFLQMSLPKETSYKVFANIPFFITSHCKKADESCSPAGGNLAGGGKRGGPAADGTSAGDKGLPAPENRMGGRDCLRFPAGGFSSQPLRGHGAASSVPQSGLGCGSRRPTPV